MIERFASGWQSSSQKQLSFFIFFPYLTGVLRRLLSLH